MIASHYAEPLVRRIQADTAFLPSPDEVAAPIAMLSAGEEIRILDNSRGWAWGYGPDGQVGYVRSDSLTA